MSAHTTHTPGPPITGYIGWSPDYNAMELRYMPTPSLSEFPDAFPESPSELARLREVNAALLSALEACQKALAPLKGKDWFANTSDPEFNEGYVTCGLSVADARNAIAAYEAALARTA